MLFTYKQYIILCLLPKIEPNLCTLYYVCGQAQSPANAPATMPVAKHIAQPMPQLLCLWPNMLTYVADLKDWDNNNKNVSSFRIGVNPLYKLAIPFPAPLFFELTTWFSRILNCYIFQLEQFSMLYRVFKLDMQEKKTQLIKPSKMYF